MSAQQKQLLHVREKEFRNFVEHYKKKDVSVRNQVQIKDHNLQTIMCFKFEK